jgi:hypothetical protein
MKTIWCFGDSFTEGENCRPGDDFYEKYKKEGDKIWPNWLSEWTGIDVINKGKCGASNDMIFDSIISKFDDFKEGDCVIIGKTFSGRFDVPYKNKNDDKILVPVFAYWTQEGNDVTKSYTKEQMETILNFQYYFSADKLYEERQNKRFDFIIKRLKEKNVNVIYWFWNEIYTQHETIDKASNFTILDGHWSLDGHKTFAIYLATKFFSNLNGYDISGVDFKNIKTII